jgi:hypothetical protein
MSDLPRTTPDEAVASRCQAMMKLIGFVVVVLVGANFANNYLVSTRAKQLAATVRPGDGWSMETSVPLLSILLTEFDVPVSLHQNGSSEFSVKVHFTGRCIAGGCTSTLDPNSLLTM